MNMAFWGLFAGLLIVSISNDRMKKKNKNKLKIKTKVDNPIKLKKDDQ